MLSVDFRAVKIGSMPCGADPAVRLASEGEVAAGEADPRVERPRAWTVGVVAVTAVVVLAGGALEYVAGALEGCELDAAPAELGAKLSKSCSCC